MMLTSAQIDDLFTYVPPDEKRAAAHGAINAAAGEVSNTLVFITDQLLEITGGSHWRGNPAFSPQAFSPLFGILTESCKQFAIIANQNCPPSADLAASIRCIRLVRNAMNELICRARAARGYPLVNIEDDNLLRIARDELCKARWQANAAIALTAQKEQPRG